MIGRGKEELRRLSEARWKKSHLTVRRWESEKHKSWPPTAQKWEAQRIEYDRVYITDWICVEHREEVQRNL